jgi:hypothetical protein
VGRWGEWGWVADNDLEHAFSKEVSYNDRRMGIAEQFRGT